MSDFCFACAAPLSVPDFKGPADDYCKHCTDEEGNLLPREQIQAGIAQWLKSWAPGITDEQAMERADDYMKAMPAWAE